MRGIASLRSQEEPAWRAGEPRSRRLRALGRAAAEARPSLPCADNHGTLCSTRLSPPVTWAGINMFVFLSLTS